jgi:thioredoxin reductase (NADPH)
MQGMENEAHRTDIAIIGAGPVGLFAVFECGMLKLSCHVIDALDEAGGQCTALYPEKPIYDVPGYPRILAHDLVERLQEQAAPFQPAYHLGQQVTGLTQSAAGRWRVETSAGTVIDAAAVLIAAGVGAFGPNRPPLPGIEAFEGQGAGRGVHYLVKRRDDFAGRRVVIAGGGDSAVDWALALADVAASVAVVHRRPKFRAAPESAARLQALAAAGTVELVVPYQLHRLAGGGGALEAVVVADFDGGERTLPADALLPFFGLSQNLGPIAEWGLNLHRNHIAVDPASCGTGRPGLFAIGDIATYPGKLKLILTGFAEAAMAAHAAFAIVHPGEALHFEYSTTKGLPTLT